MSFSRKPVYKCEILSLSANIKSLKLLSFLLPFYQSYKGLSSDVKRFTLFRSPLGNKRSKEQFEKYEHRAHFFMESSKPSGILAYVYILNFLNDVKCKVKVSNRLTQ